MNPMEPAEPRDPRKVRFWGWIAVGVAIVIAIIYLLLGHPWNKRHSSTGSAAACVVLVTSQGGRMQL
jgi:membrane protein YdbS with pleckstrin-like domain